jgi:Cu(I)/Ag(I) efflux system membrane fusion protein
MNIFRWILFAGLLLLAVVSAGSYALSKRPAAAAKQAAQKALYQCPMHPSYTSDKPGECPICGMALEPVVAPEQHAGHAAAGHDGNVPGLASVHISPERVQMIGVRTARVERSPLGAELDLVGFITPDETRLRRVQIRAAGWVQQLVVNQTGERVTAGQPLLAIYSPELFQSEQEYLIERGARDSMSGSGAGEAGGAERLRLLGVPEEEIRRLDREGSAATRLVLRSPVSGTVLERGVVEGQYVSADTPLLTVADLSRVWVLADLYEMDFTRVRVGNPARFTADALPGRAFEGPVQFVYPTVSNETRTLKVRIALDNRDGSLRPGMYGRVRITGQAAPALSVPAEAVVNTGEHTYVFLAHEGGHFEPRMVWTGLSGGDRMQILKGLAEGDTVVASASFLIDSESRLKAAIAGMGAQPTTGHQH